MSIRTGKAQLEAALKELLIKWDHTQTRWNDPVSKDFDKEFITPIDRRIKSAIPAIEKLADVLHKARRDCQ